MTTHDERYEEMREEMKDTPLVDDAVQAVHDHAPDAESVRLAADRVWQKLNAEARAAAPRADAGTDLETCDDYQSLLPAYVAGDLPEARRLLLEDHSRECVACRRALIAARSGQTAQDAAPAPPQHQRRWLSLAAAAVLVLTASVFGYLLWDGAFTGGPVGTVASVDGSLLAVEADDLAMKPLGGGAVVGTGEPVRTAKGSTAVVQLTDGSLVEMAERTQIRVRERRSGTTVFVDRGSIIVEAAPQPRRRNLFVSTDEALVSVTGTIFAVQHGVKGSRVSVVEGEVRVRQGRDETVLHPGQQVSTRANLTAVPVAEQIAWSRNVDQYLGLLSELTALRQEIVQRVAPAELRYESALAPIVPADTLVYAALPNISGTLAETYQVFQDRLAASPVLADLWNRQGPKQQAELEEAVERLRDFGSYLGPEVVLALVSDTAGGDPDAPVILATVTRPDSFRTYLEQELERLRSEEGELEELVLVDDLADLPEGDGALLVWLGDGLLVASNDAARLLETVQSARAGGSGFAATELGRAVAAAYADGTQWLMAADLARIVDGEVERDPELAHTGFGEVERLVVERWDEGERATMSAELSFASERHGVASWLAAPAPMGSLEFVSADAHLAAAFVVKEPSALLDDVLAMQATAGEDGGDFREIEEKLGLSMRDDFAAALGGEAAFAIDGPFLPEPSWKVIVEVYDPATLQHTVMTAVAEANQHLQEEGEEGRLTLVSTTAGGQTFFHLASPEGHEIHYVYAGGYVVVAPSQALLERTLAQRAAGSTLTTAARFRDLLPRDGQAGFSALFFQHLGPLLSPLGGTAARLGGSNLTPEQEQALAALAAESEPTLAYAYGEPDRIVVAGTGPGGPLGLGMHTLAGIGGMSSFAHALSAGAEAAAENE